ncbi:MAG: hypothetical protein Q7S65_03005 [Nanoarchaeota archaeon]|nr:hypothetical protein [Nanoarchaeota archaeon]
MDPIVQEPGLELCGKVLQLYVDGNPHLMIGDSEGRHAEQLEALLTREGIPFERRALRGDSFGPGQAGERYRVVGGGWMGLYGEPMLLKGRSDAYGVSPNQEHLDALNRVLGSVQYAIEQPAPVQPSNPLTKPKEEIPLDDFPF